MPGEVVVCPQTKTCSKPETLTDLSWHQMWRHQWHHMFSCGHTGIGRSSPVPVTPDRKQGGRLLSDSGRRRGRFEPGKGGPRQPGGPLPPGSADRQGAKETRDRTLQWGKKTPPQNQAWDLPRNPPLQWRAWLGLGRPLDLGARGAGGEESDHGQGEAAGRLVDTDDDDEDEDMGDGKMPARRSSRKNRGSKKSRPSSARKSLGASLLEAEQPR